MKILLLEKSFQIRKRLIKMLSNIDKITTISTISDLEDIYTCLSETQYDVLIADISDFKNFNIDYITRIKNRHVISLLILLSDFVNGYIKKTWETSGADYLLDKAHEFEKLTDILEKYLDVNKPEKINELKVREGKAVNSYH